MIGGWAFFFFQAEDGIRDLTVTGVQTCALPILLVSHLGRPGGEVDARLSMAPVAQRLRDRKSTRLNSSHSQISYAVFCLKKKKNTTRDALMHAQRREHTPVAFTADVIIERCNVH